MSKWLPIDSVITMVENKLNIEDIEAWICPTVAII